MLNEEKIRLMTGIAMFEKKAGKEILPASRYFKSDYIGSRMIRSFLSYTLTCVFCFTLWLLYQFEELLNTIDLTALLELAKRLGIFYAAGLIVYLFITQRVYSRRYHTAVKKMKVYQAKLRRLEKKYDAQPSARDSEEGRYL